MRFQVSGHQPQVDPKIVPGQVCTFDPPRTQSGIATPTTHMHEGSGTCMHLRNCRISESELHLREYRLTSSLNDINK